MNNKRTDKKRFNISALLLAVIAAILPMTAIGQVRFVTKAPSVAEVGEVVRVQYVINSANATGFQGPVFKNAECLSDVAVSTYNSIEIINGRKSSNSSVTYTYLISFNKSGRQTIPGARVRVGGKTYASRPVAVNVRRGGGRHSSASGSSRRSSSGNTQVQAAGSPVTKSDLFFTTTTNKKRVYEQEPIVLTYKAHAKIGVGLSNIMLRQKPDLNGFLSQEVQLPKNLSPTAERINGRLYKTVTNMQYVLFPQQTGRLQIPGLQFDCEVVQQNAALDEIDAFFNGGGLSSLRVRRSSPSLSVEVVPLPLPKPASFSGGVGQFTISGNVLGKQIKTNEICTYRIVVKGAGNMKLIKAPTVNFPKDFDKFDPKITDKTKLTVGGVAGEVVYDYTFVPRNKGEYTLPAVEFTYFDINSETYKTIRTSAIKLNVEQGKRSYEDLQQQMRLKDQDILPIIQGEKESPRTEAMMWGGWGYWLINALLLIAFGAACMMLRRYNAMMADTVGLKSRRAFKQVGLQLKQAKRLLASGNSREFYAELSKALSTYVANKFAKGGSLPGRNEATTILTQNGVSADVVDKYSKVFEKCEFAQFSNSADISGKQQIYDEAYDAICSVEQCLSNKPKTPKQ